MICNFFFLKGKSQEAQLCSAKKYWLSRTVNACKIDSEEVSQTSHKHNSLLWSLRSPSFCCCRCLQTAELFFNVIHRCGVSMRAKLSRLLLSVFNPPILYLSLMLPLYNQNMTEKKHKFSIYTVQKGLGTTYYLKMIFLGPRTSCSQSYWHRVVCVSAIMSPKVHENTQKLKQA